jgi:hypothetical protein
LIHTANPLDRSHKKWALTPVRKPHRMHQGWRPPMIPPHLMVHRPYLTVLLHNIRKRNEAVKEVRCAASRGALRLNRDRTNPAAPEPHSSALGAGDGPCTTLHSSRFWGRLKSWGSFLNHNPSGASPVAGA